jgi:hypothetical protein
LAGGDQKIISKETPRERLAEIIELKNKKGVVVRQRPLDLLEFNLSRP